MAGLIGEIKEIKIQKNKKLTKNKNKN